VPTASTEKNGCAICGKRVEGFLARFVTEYPHVVCRECKGRAVSCRGEAPGSGTVYDSQIPLFIDGFKCWRQWRFSGFIVMRDLFDCKTRDEFYFQAKRAREKALAQKKSRVPTTTGNAGRLQKLNGPTTKKR